MLMLQVGFPGTREALLLLREWDLLVERAVIGRWRLGVKSAWAMGTEVSICLFEKTVSFTRKRVFSDIETHSRVSVQELEVFGNGICSELAWKTHIGDGEIVTCCPGPLFPS